MSECANCHSHYALRDGHVPTKYCDECAHVIAASVEQREEELAESKRRYSLAECDLDEKNMAVAASQQREAELKEQLEEALEDIHGAGGYRQREAELAAGWKVKNEALKPVYENLCSLRVSHPHLVPLSLLDKLKQALALQPHDALRPSLE